MTRLSGIQLDGRSAAAGRGNISGQVGRTDSDSGRARCWLESSCLGRMDGGIAELREREAQCTDRWSAAEIQPGVLMSRRCDVTQFVDERTQLRGEKQQAEAEREYELTHALRASNRITRTTPKYQSLVAGGTAFSCSHSKSVEAVTRLATMVGNESPDPRPLELSSEVVRVTATPC